MSKRVLRHFTCQDCGGMAQGYGKGEPETICNDFEDESEDQYAPNLRAVGCPHCGAPSGIIGEAVDDSEYGDEA